MSAEAKLKSLGLVLPPPSKPSANYKAFVQQGDMLYLSGIGPARPDGTFVTGRLGADLDVPQGYEAAKLCGLVLLANMRAALGSLDRVERIVKVLGMVRAVPEFEHSPSVIDGCTDLFVAVFGDAGRPARSAVGLTALPHAIAVEIEAIVAIRP
jgi:enamine deaminase RidA (YjgF/YER057c/UK114 family)